MNQEKIKNIIHELKKQNITLVAASKGRTEKEIRNIYSLGITHFGENYVQEAETKIKVLADLNITWHCIGHVQSSKVNKAKRLFQNIDTIDSEELAKKIDGNILLQVNISIEKQKKGILPEEIPELLKKIKELQNVICQGFMMIGSKENS